MCFFCLCLGVSWWVVRLPVHSPKPRHPVGASTRLGDASPSFSSASSLAGTVIPGFPPPVQREQRNHPVMVWSSPPELPVLGEGRTHRPVDSRPGSHTRTGARLLVIDGYR